MKVAEMMPTLRWALATPSGVMHIQFGETPECGQRGTFPCTPYALERLQHRNVCKRCLKATEKYA